MKRFLKIALALVVVGAVLFGARALLFRAQIETTDQGVVARPIGQEEMIRVVAKGLKVPWAMAFLPEGGVLVTERGGTLHVMHDLDTDASSDTAILVSGVHAGGEGGLLGIAIHPDFTAKKFVYLYLTVSAGGKVTNRVDRFVLDNATLSGRTTIIQGIPGGLYHDGGGLAFGPDRKLYVGTGEGGDASRSQDPTSLGGKILRLNDDGTVPKDNPSGTAVWALGLRNPQSMVWDGQGRMWATDHGRSGLQTGLDEINLIEPGKNYGWPTSQGDETQSGQEKAYAHSGPVETWAPAGIAWLRPSLLFTGLRGESLYELNLEDNPSRRVVAHFQRQFGRLRSVKVGPDGMLYVTTSNQDGRGSPKDGDDKILRMNPRILGR